MVQRLQKVKPVYRISDWIDDWQKSEELAQRITTYPTKSPVSYLLCIVGFEGENYGVSSKNFAVKKCPTPAVKIGCHKISKNFTQNL